MSIAMTVTPRSFSAPINASFCAGYRNEISVCPLRVIATSLSSGGRTLATISAVLHKDAASGTTVTPAASNAASEMRAASPAPASIRQSKPSF